MPVRFLWLNHGCHRNLPFVNLQGDRPLYLQQQLLNSDGPHDVPRDFCPPRLPALRGPKQKFGDTAQNFRIHPLSR